MKKYSNIYFDKIIKLAKNKTTSNMSCRKISRIINTSLNKRNIKYRGKQLKISFKTISNYLREIYGRPKKLRKAFYLSEVQKKARVDFWKKYYKRVLLLAFNVYRWVSIWFRRIYQRLVQTSLRFITKIEKRKSRGLWYINNSIKKFKPIIMIEEEEYHILV